MVRISVLNDALRSMYNAEKCGKRQVMIRPSSKVIIKFLQVMQKHGYIGEFELIDDHRSGKVVVELNGRLNKCGVISPRFDVGVKEIESWTARLLPSRQFGFIVLTTSAGIMDHDEARRKNPEVAERVFIGINSSITLEVYYFFLFFCMHQFKYVQKFIISGVFTTTNALLIYSMIANIIGFEASHVLPFLGLIIYMITNRVGLRLMS
ncbi:hypothetical protein SUGI_0444290 [Cryptomeria japonica]|nr:hypothetical protein SUGI_0444290 [Cryptomeria japonica]